ncbi:flavodoxin [Candidatus Mycolicibacterium alkanivorans]|uniref:flavodoxin n=1 Tax=Candidatus Mycolicibacterium alkanivorans TaxID=2954114 RepID=UPI001FAA1295|nr:flavodoxin [Candidatus Mycolicibacterium alkanivorans]
MADRMAEVLGAQVVEPEAVDLATLREYDLVGFGSGIYFNAVHSRLRRLIHSLPHVDGGRAFTFFTSGGPEVPLVGYSRSIRRQLASTGFDVLDSFSCRGLDTVGSLRLIGGLNKRRPNDRDLGRAAAFALRLRERVMHSKSAS